MAVKIRFERNDAGFQAEGEGFRILLTFHNNDLELHGTVTVAAAGSYFDEISLFHALKQLPLQGEIHHKNLREFCHCADNGENVAGMVLMYGRKPRPGAAGKVELPPANSCGIINVRRGQVAARIVPPQTGEVGMTLKGATITPITGKPLKVKLGDGVSRDDDEQEKILATQDGQVIYDRVGALLRVSGQIRIDGNVDYRNGYLDFVGDIEITGDVGPGCRIKAGKSLRIKGNVESSEIEAGETMEIMGGVSGKNRGCLRSGGNMTLRYADICGIECGGNLMVKNEIVDSKVVAEGYVDVSGGSIIGGRVMALGGIEARIIGSELGVPTQLISGRSSKIEHDIRTIQEAQNCLKADFSRLGHKIKPYISNPELLAPLTPGEKQQLRELTDKYSHIRKQLRELAIKHRDTQELMLHHANPMVNVIRTLCKGVELNIDGSALRITEPVHRSITIVKNSHNGSLRVISRIRLTDNARKVEEIIAAQEMHRQHHREETSPSPSTTPEP
ncbi:MAG: FapA family protein [Victivallales bacterium]|nr:FapA family protein [Victivallales bacterium]